MRITLIVEHNQGERERDPYHTMNNGKPGKATFHKNSAVKFRNSITGKEEWYVCDYFPKSSIPFKDILCGNPKEIQVICLDDEIAILETSAVTLEF